MLMKKITLFLIAVAALAFAAHAGQLSASPGTTTSVEPAIANSLSGLSQPVDETEQTWAPTFYGYSEDGVQGFGVRIIETEPSTIYYRIMYPFPDGEWTDWIEYTDMLTFTEVGRYRVEAYAVAPGKSPSQTIAYEFVVMPIVQPGDLNHDGILGIEDVTTLIDIIISNSTPTPECDVNQDGSVDIADVTDLIDYILAQ